MLLLAVLLAAALARVPRADAPSSTQARLESDSTKVAKGTLSVHELSNETVEEDGLECSACLLTGKPETEEKLALKERLRKSAAALAFLHACGVELLLRLAAHAESLKK